MGGGWWGWKVLVLICIILIGILMIILYYCWVLSSDTCNRYCNGTLTFIRFLHNLILWSQPLWLLLEISSMQLILGTCGICFYGWIMRLDEQTRVALMEYTWNYLGLLLVCLAIFIWANSIKIGRFKVDKPLWTFCI